MCPISEEFCCSAGKAGTSAPFHLFGKLTHGFLRDDMSFATRKSGFRFVNRRKDFQPSPLAFFHRDKRFLPPVFLTATGPSR